MARNSQTINVTFTANPSPTVRCSPPSVDVDYGDELDLTLSLAAGNTGAVFASAPVTWDNGSSPPGVSVRRDSDSQVTIDETDSNQSGADQQYSFRAVVSYGGTSYSSEDPLIINKPYQPT